MYKALTASVVIGAALSASYNDELDFSIERGADGQMDFVATLHNVNNALAVYDDIDERGQIIQDLFGDEGKKGLVPLLWIRRWRHWRAVTAFASCPTASPRRTSLV